MTPEEVAALVERERRLRAAILQGGAATTKAAEVRRTIIKELVAQQGNNATARLLGLHPTTVSKINLSQPQPPPSEHQ